MTECKVFCSECFYFYPYNVDGHYGGCKYGKVPVPDNPISKGEGYKWIYNPYEQNKQNDCGFYKPKLKIPRWKKFLLDSDISFFPMEFLRKEGEID